MPCASRNTTHMDNNDILKSLRYTFDFNDTTMIEIFGLGGMSVTRAEVSDWLKKDTDPEFKNINDESLARYLNGLIVHRRGEKGEVPAPEQQLNNNIVFRKLKIALNLRDEDILKILGKVGREISKHELSAFFRKPDQRQYRPCGDQILRNFLQGLQLTFRGD